MKKILPAIAILALFTCTTHAQTPAENTGLTKTGSVGLETPQKPQPKKVEAATPQPTPQPTGAVGLEAPKQTPPKTTPKEKYPEAKNTGEIKEKGSSQEKIQAVVEPTPKTTAQTTLSAGKIQADPLENTPQTAIIIVDEINAKRLAEYIQNILNREIYIITDNPELEKALKQQ